MSSISEPSSPPIKKKFESIEGFTEKNEDDFFPITSLPVELIVKIFSKLSNINDLMNARVASKSFFDLIDVKESCRTVGDSIGINVDNHKIENFKDFLDLFKIKAKDTVIVWKKIIKEVNTGANELTVANPDFENLENENPLEIIKTFDEWIAKNKIEDISKFRDLCRLDLSSLQIQLLPNSIGNLGPLKAIFLLNLQNNQLKALPDSLGKLKLLDLSLQNNQLQALPDCLGNLINLCFLDFSHNLLKALPSSLGKLIYLQNLNLSHNQLQAMPDSIGKFTKLTSLDLSHNQLTELPGSLGKLIHLQHLNLSHNLLKALPDSLRKLKFIEGLDLSYNQLKVLPDCIDPYVLYLDLSHNQLTELPDSLGNLEGLICLELQNNQLTALSKCIENLPQLEQLNVETNPLNNDSIELVKNLECETFL